MDNNNDTALSTQKAVNKAYSTKPTAPFFRVELGAWNSEGRLDI